MKNHLLLLLLFLASCTIEETAQPKCDDFHLIDEGRTIKVVIMSSEEFTVLKYSYRDGTYREKIIRRHYYNCVRIGRNGYPMSFEINDCKTEI